MNDSHSADPFRTDLTDSNAASRRVHFLKQLKRAGVPVRIAW